jgi:type IX secretion system substrate protein
MKKHYLVLSILTLVILLSFTTENVSAQEGSIVFNEAIDSGITMKSTADYDLRSIKLFPNPSTNYFYLSSNTAIPLRRISIANILGNTVWELTLTDSEPIQKIQIPVMDLKNGVYFVEIFTDNQRITKKISKE